jgi:hypothetical protein
MPGVAFHFEVVKQITDALLASDPAKGKMLDQHPEFARLGALGPDLFKFIPVEAELLDAITEEGVDGLGTPQLLEMVRSPMMVCYAMLFRNVVVPLWPLLASLHTFYAQMHDIAVAEDTDQLKNMLPQAKDIEAKVPVVSGLGTKAQELLKIVGVAIVAGKPIIQTDAPLAVKQWRPFEFLRWIRSGQFARRLVTLAGQASAANRAKLTAYAYGYLAHVAGSVTAEPFVNNIVRGPYRTHWWRNRYVANYVDAWTHDRFNTAGASVAGDNPTPPYDQWSDVCEAKLHERIAFAAPVVTGFDAATTVGNGTVGTANVAALDAVASMFMQAVADTYNPSIVPASITADNFKRASTGAYAVLWLMTSGEGALCVRPPDGPPADCLDEPAWVSSGGSPPSPAEETSGDTGCAVALAILAILLLLTGNWAAGVAALVGAIEAAQGGFAVDWAQLRCNVYWQRQHLYEIEAAIRDALILGGLAYPMAHQLGSVGPDGNTTPTDGITPSGRPMCRTQRDEKYPLVMDGTVPPGPDLNWANAPATAVEEPSTRDRQDSGTYPETVVGGLGLLNGGLNANGTYPTRDVVLGDAVANAKQIIQSDGAGLPDYNLDGDRGYGWKAWRPKINTKPYTPPVVDDPVT